MKPTAGESSVSFVLRVEAERRKLGCALGVTYHAFIKQLDLPLRAKLDAIRLSRKAGGGGMPFSWK